MKNRTLTLTLAAVAAIAVACYKDSPAPTATTKTTGTTTPTTPAAPINNNITFTATMTGAKEVPVNTSTGTGTFTATLDTATNVFIYDFTFTGLTTPVNNGHIHGPGAATVSVGTTINFNTWPGASFVGFGGTSGTGHGLALLTAGTQITATMNGDSLKKILLAGLTYANIHTTQNAGGEIRGQITRVP